MTVKKKKDENLSWTHHVANLSSKIARTVFMIKQVKYILPNDSLKTLYYALIQSPDLWHPSMGKCFKLYTEKLKYFKKGQYAASTRLTTTVILIHFSNKSKIKKLTDINETQILLFIHNYVSNKLPASFVRFCDRTIGCDLVSYDRSAMFAAISFYNRTLWCILYDWL